jgi:hypothetical protein
VQLLGNNVYAHVAASLVSGVGLVIAMNPFDVVATRLYNQKVEAGKGTLYKGSPTPFLVVRVVNAYDCSTLTHQ